VAGRESRYLVYGSDAVEIVRFIKRAQGLGSTCDEVAVRFGLMGGGPDDCGRACQLAERRIAGLDRRITGCVMSVC
jgi:hypothetical protein